MDESNFLFLKQNDSVFFQLASLEQFLRTDKNTIFLKMHQLLEVFVKEIVFQVELVPQDPNDNLLRNY